MLGNAVLVLGSWPELIRKVVCIEKKKQTAIPVQGHIGKLPRFTEPKLLFLLFWFQFAQVGWECWKQVALLQTECLWALRWYFHKALSNSKGILWTNAAVIP